MTGKRRRAISDKITEKKKEKKFNFQMASPLTDTLSKFKV